MSSLPLKSPLLYVVAVVATATVLEPLWRWLLVAELGLVAWRVWSRGGSRRLYGGLATFGVARALIVLPLALYLHPVSTPLHGLRVEQFLELARPRMIFAAIEVLWSLASLGHVFAIVLGLLVIPLVRERGKSDALGFVLVAGVLPLLGFVEPVRLQGLKQLDRETLVAAVGITKFEFGPNDLTERALPSTLPTEGTTERVTLIMLESVGALNVLAHLERVPDGPFARLIERGAFYERVLSASNASHMAQPAALLSRELSRGVGLRISPAQEPPGWGFAEHFKAKGWRTIMQSSQDESWLGMDGFTMSPAFDTAKHAKDETRRDLTYVDACGTRKVFDSRTMANYRTLREEDGALFAYLNLQNSHFPYIVESDGDRAASRELTCKDIHSAPAWKLVIARHQHARALDELLERLAHLIAEEPETLFVLTGDHGEGMNGGEDFAHAHRPIPDQMETFALFIGPGVTPLHERRSISSLDLLPTTIALVSPDDLALLPRDAVQGVDARSYGDADRLQISVSYGLQPTSYAVDSGAYWYQVGEPEMACIEARERPVSLTRCALHKEALSHWLSCKEAFYARDDHAAHFEPCWRLTRERYSEGAPVRRPPFAGEARAE